MKEQENQQTEMTKKKKCLHNWCLQLLPPKTCCKCTGASQPAPLMSWSQIIEQTPGYGLTSFSGGATTLSTSMGDMPESVVPPPGLTLPDFSIWSMPPLEAPPSLGLPVSPWYQPPVGRASLLRAAIDSKAQALWATVPQAPTLQVPILKSPQRAPSLCQPLTSSRS